MSTIYTCRVCLSNNFKFDHNGFTTFYFCCENCKIFPDVKAPQIHNQHQFIFVKDEAGELRYDYFNLAINNELDNGFYLRFKIYVWYENNSTIITKAFYSPRGECMWHGDQISLEGKIFDLYGEDKIKDRLRIILALE